MLDVNLCPLPPKPQRGKRKHSRGRESPEPTSPSHKPRRWRQAVVHQFLSKSGISSPVYARPSIQISTFVSYSSKMRFITSEYLRVFMEIQSLIIKPAISHCCHCENLLILTSSIHPNCLSLKNCNTHFAFWQEFLNYQKKFEELQFVVLSPNQ
jgi:hypothetical protein